MIIFIKFSKIIRYLFIIIVLILLGLVLFQLNKDTISKTVFMTKPTNLVLQSDIEEIFDIRNSAILNEDIKSLSSIFNIEDRNGRWSYDYEINTIKYLNQWTDKQSARFNKIDSKVFLRKTEKTDHGYSVNLAVTTEYEYSYNDLLSTSNSFRICTYHSLDLIPNEDSWMITKEWYQDPVVNSFFDINKLNIEKIKEVILSNEKKDVSDLNERRQGAVNYANEYSGVAKPPDYDFHYNSKYKNCNYMGGNCTNFASQVLYEGGEFSKTDTWNYEGRDGSKAWVNAHAFNDYMLYSGRGSLISNGSYEEVLTDSYKLLPGDYICYEKKGKIAHTAIVTGIDSKGYALINSHTPDTHKVPFDLGWGGDEIKFWLVRVNY